MRRIVAAGVLLSLAVACTGSEERAGRMRQAVRGALAERDRPRALAAIGALQRTLPGTPETAIELASLLVAAGSAPEAGWLLEEAVRRHPQHVELRLARGRAALLLGNPSLARESALSVASLGPTAEEELSASILSANAELALGDLAAALETLSRADERHPDRPTARLARITALHSEHRDDEVRALIEELLPALADEADAPLRRQLRIALAQIRAQTGERDEAIAALGDIVAAAPGDVLAWRSWLGLLVQAQRGEEGLAALDAALAVPDPPLELLSISAELRAALGRVDEAVSALQQLSERATTPAAYYELIEILFRHDRTGEAASALDEALDRFPDHPRLRMMRADHLLDQERVDEARAELRRFASATFEGDPQIAYLEARIALAEGDAERAAGQLRALAPRLDRAATHFWLGRALEQMGDLEGARRRYALALRRDPSWITPITALAAIEARRGNLGEVAAHAQTLVRYAPWRLDGYRLWVEALAGLGEGSAAEAVARRSVRRFPDRKEPHVLLAKALRAQGRTDEALAALDAGAPEGADAQAERALTLGLGGRVHEGIALSEAALATHPESAALHAAHAAMLFAAGDAERGAAATDRALALAPDEPHPLRVRCEFRASERSWAAAREDCTRYLAARPDDAGAHFVLGVACAQLGDPEAAIAAYRRAAALDERDARPRNNLAQLLAEAGDLAGALAAAQEAYRLDAESPFVLDTLGALYLREGRVERAVSLLEQAHAAAPRLPEAGLNLARAYTAGGRAAEARQLLSALLADPAADAALRSRAEDALDSLP